MPTSAPIFQLVSLSGRRNRFALFTHQLKCMKMLLSWINKHNSHTTTRKWTVCLKTNIVCLISLQNRKVNLQWARVHINWIHEQWQSALFTIESRFSAHWLSTKTDLIESRDILQLCGTSINVEREIWWCGCVCLGWHFSWGKHGTVRARAWNHASSAI